LHDLLSLVTGCRVAPADQFDRIPGEEASAGKYQSGRNRKAISEDSAGKDVFVDSDARSERQKAQSPPRPLSIGEGGPLPPSTRR